MEAMSRSSLLVVSVLGLFTALAGFLTWAVLAGGYRDGVVIPAAVVLGVMAAALRLLWARSTRRRRANGMAMPNATRSTWALATFVLGVLMGWLCAELVGFVLLPVLWVVIIPRARRQGLLPVTLPPFGLGLVLLPLSFLAVDLRAGGFSWSFVLWFTPEVVIGALLMLPFFRHTTHSATSPIPR